MATMPNLKIELVDDVRTVSPADSIVCVPVIDQDNVRTVSAEDVVYELMWRGGTDRLMELGWRVRLLLWRGPTTASLELFPPLGAAAMRVCLGERHIYDRIRAILDV
jgi:hypothetical protein